MRLLLLSLWLLAGCASEHFTLPEEYAPLKEIRERGHPVDFILKDSAVTTIGDTVYVKDLDAFLDKRPPGSIHFRALMLHEQEHARRQAKDGVWLAKYVSSAEFAWAEEQRGWYYEITALRANGLNPNPDAIAGVLAGYKIIGGHIVSFADARAWVLDVLAGRWRPE